MSSYLGVHLSLISNVDWFFAQAKPRIAKVLLPGADPDRLRALAQLSPGTTWVGRFVLDAQPLDHPAQSGREMAERIIAVAQAYPDIDFWEGYNEVSFTRYQDEQDPARREQLFQQAAYEMASFSEHEIQRTMTLHQAGLKSAAGGFSMGTPELDLWPFFYPVLDYADALHVHEYAAPSMKQLSSWLCGRFARVYEVLPSKLRIPLIVSECGIDGGGFRGWKSFVDAAAYMADLRWYDELLQSYARRWPILGATIFGWWGRGGYSFDSFDIDGTLADLLCRYIVSTRQSKIITIWEGVLRLLRRIRGR